MILKVHKAFNGKKILAICDDNIINKYFEEGGLQLDLRSNFYKGKKIDKVSILKEIKEAYIIHFVGDESVSFGIEQKLIDKENIKKIKNIPYAHVLIF